MVRDRLLYWLDGHPRLRLVVRGGYLCVVSPRGAWAKIRERIRNKLDAALEPYRRLRTSTYAADPVPGEPNPVFSVPVESLRNEANTIRIMSAMTLDHQFDLLGSGWVKVERNRRREGLRGHVYEPQRLDDSRPYGTWLAEHVTPGNLKAAARIGGLVSPGYAPLSWEEDFKSGYRWPVDAHRTQLTYGDKPGVDVKVPWELSRMQHLPWLAFAAMLSRDGAPGFESPDRYVREFMDQSLDFMAANPPQYGPNWLCTMDVAFRAVSLIAAHDFFSNAGFAFPDAFEREFRRSIRDHAEHVVAHLEYHPTIRANHYYSDVVGLLFVAAWLPSAPETDSWFAFAVQEYLNESRLQFHADGSGFEASTSYHRLCAEMLVYGAALIEGLPERQAARLRGYAHTLWKFTPPLGPTLDLDLSGDRIILPGWLQERIVHARSFTRDVISPSGEAVQIGDNDSGRFLKLFPAIAVRSGAETAARFDNLTGPAPEAYPFEVVGDYRHLLSAFDGHLAGAGKGDDPERTVVAGLARRSDARPVGATDAPGFAAYPDFGLWIWRRGDFFLTVRCGHNGQYDNGGHAHNDQLSVTLACAGLDFFVDPGTYLYTPLPEWRNRFRATRAHNTVAADAEQNGFKEITLFSLHNQAKPEVLRADGDGFEGRHVGFGQEHVRRLGWKDGGVRVEDRCLAEGATVNLCLHPEVRASVPEPGRVELRRGAVGLTVTGLDWTVEPADFSPGYGWVMHTERLTAPLRGGAAVWSVSPLATSRDI